MNQTVEEYFHDFRQDMLAGAEANENYQLAEFMASVTNELMETGATEGFEFCPYRAQRGMRVDGYWFNDDGVLDLFIADFDCRAELTSLTETEVKAAFKRLSKFFSASRDKKLFQDLEETAPEYGLSRQIHDRKNLIRRVNLFILSERTLSSRLQALDDDELSGIPASYHIWDISRLHRQDSSKGHKEALDIDFIEMFDQGLSSLPAHLRTDALESYLIVIPGNILADLYEKYGARLLEQNVRCFLQARGKVNKGIRTTIMGEPDMFFAYNNGITATAQSVESRVTENGLEITNLKDLQIVNGGQTTASLFHTRKKDKASLSNIFVQMKLSVIQGMQSEEIVPRISEYANTQNRVNAADFFSNHPFHIRMEEFSRRIWAPAQQGAQRETRWFYERARGQYADAMSKMTDAEKKRFRIEHPKPQMFTKTDLAKFENIWDDAPKWVNLGAQKNFARYAHRTGVTWKKSADQYSEFYFKRAMARAICFRTTEKLVSAQPWYNGGFRANIVAYTLAVIAEYCRTKDKAIDFIEIWKKQTLPQSFIEALEVVSEFVNEQLLHMPQGISHISEWAKKDGCWEGMKNNINAVEKKLSVEFIEGLISIDEVKTEKKQARKDQRIDNGIDAQKRVFEISAEKWQEIRIFGEQKKLLSPKEIGVLSIAAQLPKKVPSEKQCIILTDIIQKIKAEAFEI
ncbi:AIPR family protein [Kordiimonas pumila]|uniref:AIPR family protein n=1 Tax=Kordiimonas pumila TaxID=2161677 RepID=A0ABV7D0H1_9PROT|nr:AIPR family protein [Kordiimonas pumila]